MSENLNIRNWYSFEPKKIENVSRSSSRRGSVSSAGSGLSATSAPSSLNLEEHGLLESRNLNYGSLTVQLLYKSKANLLQVTISEGKLFPSAFSPPFLFFFLR